MDLKDRTALKCLIVASCTKENSNIPPYPSSPWAKHLFIDEQ